MVQETQAEKHSLFNLTEEHLSVALTLELVESINKNEADVIVELTQVKTVDDEAVVALNEALTTWLDERIVIFVGDEDSLTSLGLLAEEVPSVPSYEEAVDYLFMMQLERELGDGE